MSSASRGLGLTVLLLRNLAQVSVSYDGPGHSMFQYSHILTLINRGNLPFVFNFL